MAGRPPYSTQFFAGLIGSTPELVVGTGVPNTLIIREMVTNAIEPASGAPAALNGLTVFSSRGPTIFTVGPGQARTLRTFRWQGRYVMAVEDESLYAQCGEDEQWELQISGYLLTPT
jgi:hypothetical protein